jgi:hypothetical protein
MTEELPKGCSLDFRLIQKGDFPLYVCAKRIHEGGFAFQFNIDKTQNGRQIYLVFGSSNETIEKWGAANGAYALLNTVRIGSNVVNGNIYNILSSFLSFIERRKLFASFVGAQIRVFDNNRIISMSDVVAFRAPVRPVSIQDEQLANDESLLYPPKAGEGSLLTTIPVRKGYFFEKGGYFVVDDAYRGFDCSSFLRTAMGIASNKAISNLDGCKIATHLGYSLVYQCDSTMDVREYLRARISPAIVQFDWVATDKEGKSVPLGHCVLVKRGFVYEFNKQGAKSKGLTPGKGRAPKDFCTSVGLAAKNGGGFVTILSEWRKNDDKNKKQYKIFMSLKGDFESGGKYAAVA